MDSLKKRNLRNKYLNKSKYKIQCKTSLVASAKDKIHERMSDIEDRAKELLYPDNNKETKISN